MNITFIGYGSMARALGSMWTARHSICFTGRNPEKAAALASELHPATTASEDQATRDAEVIVLATPHDTVSEAISAAGGPAAFAGKTVIDINNPVDIHTDFLHKTYNGLSLAESIARQIPQAHVVKAFNCCQASVWTMNPPVFDGRTLVTPICGDHPDAKQQVAQLVTDLGAEPLDIGELKYARFLEPMACFTIKLLFAGRDPHTVLNLIQPEIKPIK